MEKSFRTSMFGFNKEDVAKYIFRQDKAFEKKLEEKEAALQKAQIERDEAEKACADWQDNLAKIQALNGLLEQFKSQSSSLISAIQSEDTDINTIESSYHRMEKRCEELEACREKASKFDSLATALSGIFGSGIQNEESSLSESECSDAEPAFHQARMSIESTKHKAEALEETALEIEAILSELKL